MTGVNDFHRFLDSGLDASVEELKGYLEVESCSRDKEGVDRVGTLVAKAWEELGFEIEVLPQEHSGNHLVARRRGAGRGRLLCHMHRDTTQPRGTVTERPIEERDGPIYAACSLGVLDQAGILEAGKRADLLIANVEHYQLLVFESGVPLLDQVVVRGRVV